ncbi:MAG: discoidin domain-containing protein, partial [Bacillota bacterium]
MGKRCCVLLAALLAVLVVAFSLPSAGVRAKLSGVLPWPLRFVQMLSLEGLQVKSIETALGNGPVAVSGTIVAGAPGAVPGGDEVAVLWRGIEVGKGKAASDGSFSVPVPALPDARLSVMYGPALPELRPSVNVALMVSGHVQGTVTASSSGSSAAQACNGKFTDIWNANSGLPGWWLRDLGRELDISGVQLWFGGAGSQCRWARVSLSVDGSSFVPVAEGSVTAPESRAPESPTLSLSLPAGTRARWVKVEADSGYDWTALVEAAVLGRVPATEILSAPEWTLPEGPGFSGRAAVVGQYGQPGLPWDAVSGWPDPGA